ncbi:MAG: hypothetical protein CMN04_10615 [Roseibacillus sp.]|nr:hypothetical protein [Roseibacillus sp.]
MATVIDAQIDSKGIAIIHAAPSSPIFPGPSASRKPGLRKQFTSSKSALPMKSMMWKNDF